MAQMDQRVSCILALGNDCILVGLVSGSLSLLSPNLCQTLSVHPKEPVGNNEPVWSAVSSADNKKEWIWWSVSQVSGETHKWTVDAIVLVGDDTVPGKVRYESATTFTFTSHATTIASISCFARQISVAFSNGLSQTWQVKGSNKVSDPAALDLAFLGLEPKSLSTQILKNNYLAVVGKEVASAAGGLKLFVLDNRFGTLQHEQDLATNGLSESRLRTSMSVSSSGEDLHLCVRSDSKASFTANFFTSATDCPPMSLKMALGKSAKKGHFSSSAPGELIGPFGMSFIPSEMPGSSSKTEWKKSLDTANKSESAFMARLLAAKTEKDFEAALKAWVMAKTGVSDKNSKLSSLPPMTLSQPLLAQLNDKCFGTPATFWPREAIQYLLRSGLCNIFSCSSDIIKAILHRKDVDSLLLAMDVLKDIAEADWVAVLTFALTYAETPALDVSVKASGKWISHTAMDVDSEDQCVLTVGQEYLVYRSLTCPRNDPRLIQAFRKLPIEQVEILLKWLESVLIPEASKKRMWWFWSQEESGVQPEDYEKELSRFTAVRFHLVSTM